MGDFKRGRKKTRNTLERDNRRRKKMLQLRGEERISPYAFKRFARRKETDGVSY